MKEPGDTGVSAEEAKGFAPNGTLPDGWSLVSVPGEHPIPLTDPVTLKEMPITFVKLDCEGCELDLLQAFPTGGWRGVTRLVFEWSFTKQPDMAVFNAAVGRLEAEGFTVMYEGRGSWERMERWPWHMDALVFAWRDGHEG